MIKWAIDLDGVVSANPAALSWLTYHLMKNENDNFVYILTWRDRSNDERKKETIEDLKRFGISYSELVMCPKKLLTARAAAYWKIRQVKDLGINIWLDDEIKSFQRDYGIKVRELLPEVNLIWI